ncbi:proline-rich receptor-like protein kinase PERK9 [Hordeum vulgare subsp. vulgare]|uniref:proline-rich receptor-like protein kinase PERK9 n=1 Tax=Hordeum vulgare subsp. vulgare TaxID=112509 RepID=UPI001D1A4E31|nr:proline-rich receptor-like protein kinase PERK9 [Hordeum vulgare subsp. vulgare]KAI4974879.1 hypothetical protein ZWY2020_048486 [Hordeum vulgare]
MTSTPPGDVLPALPPIRTRAAAADPALDNASASTTTVPESEPLPAPAVAEEEDMVVAESRTPAAVADEGEEEEEPRTPTSEESKLRPPTDCPGAPRKPVALAGTRPSPKRPLRYFDAPRDLSAVFMSLPPKKRIRAPPCLVAFRPRCGAVWGHGSAL